MGGVARPARKAHRRRSKSALTTPDEAKQARPPTAGVSRRRSRSWPCTPRWITRSFQRKTRLQGTMTLRGRVRRTSTVWNARLTGKPLEGAAPDQWQALPRRPPLRTRSTLTAPAPAGGWYKLEVRAHEGRQEVASRGRGPRRRRRGVRRRRPIQLDQLRPGADQPERRAWFPRSAARTGGWPTTRSPASTTPARAAASGPRSATPWYEKYHVPIGVAVHRLFGHQRQPSGSRAAEELFEWTTTRMNRAGQGRLPRRALAPGRIGYRHESGRVRSENDDPYPDDARGGRLGRAVVRGPGVLPQPDEGPNVAAIREAQKKLWESGVALRGAGHRPALGDNRDKGGKGIHFSPKGLTAHGSMWADKVGDWLDKVLKQ